MIAPRAAAIAAACSLFLAADEVFPEAFQRIGRMKNAAEAETLHNDALPANLYVADASLFPKSMGNPPMLTIMALARRVARVAAAAVL